MKRDVLVVLLLVAALLGGLVPIHEQCDVIVCDSDERP